MSQEPYGGYTGYSSGQQQQQQQQQYAADQQQQQQQQYSGTSGTYQPPRSAMRGRSSHDATSLGWKASTEAAISYIIPLLGGLFFFLFERKNRFVRYSAAQSFFYVVFAVILTNLLKFIAGIWLIGFFFQPILWILYAIFTLIWLYMIVQAFRGKTVRLPIFSNWADWVVDKTTWGRRKKAA